MHFSNAKRWLIGLLIVALTALVCFSIRQALRVTGIQNSVDRDWEISFWAEHTPDRPTLLPKFIDTATHDWFQQRYASTAGYSGQEPAKTRNRSRIYFERFRALFRGPITDVHVYYPEGIDDLGAALVRCPSLRRMTLWETKGDFPSEADWTLLCSRLRTISTLQEISIVGIHLTDKALAPLAGHPNLRVIQILGGQLTSESTRTFEAIPNLEKLDIEGQAHEGRESWLSEESKRSMINALPKVQVNLPD